MMAANVVIERDTANDEFATIVGIYVVSGGAVEQGDPIFDIENSKATEEVQASQAGVLMHDLHVGQSIAFGEPIARILPTAPAHTASSPEVQPETAAAAACLPDDPPPLVEPIKSAPPATQRPGLRFVSHAAAGLLTQNGLSAGDFDVDFLTKQDVLAALGRQPGQQRQPPEPLAAPPKSSLAHHTPGRIKQVEIETLSKGAGATMLSVLGTSLGPITVRRPAAAFLSERITDLVIYEASRLMLKFPRLNSYFEDGHVYRHAAINAGLAIDGGERLVVYGIEDADARNLADLSDAIADAVMRYVNKELTAAELSRATFTVTDLSADCLDFVFPLLPRGQTTIIGITRDHQREYRLFVGFDHRVTEGREVAQFLTELRERLLSFCVASSPDKHMPGCAYCMRSAAEVTSKGQDRGLLKLVDRTGEEKFCCASCWNGW